MKYLFAVCLLVTSLVHTEVMAKQWELSGELIIWEPCSRDFVFAHVAAARPNRNNLFTVKPEYDAGFRIGLGYTPCTRSFTADFKYTYWEGCSDRTVSGTNLRLEVPNFSLNLIQVDGRRKLQYQEVDLRLSRPITCQIIAVGGMRYLYLEANECVTGTQAPPTNPVTIAQRDKFSGFAFEGGLTGSRTLCRNLYLKGQILGLIGVGDQTNSWAVLSGAGAGISAYGGSVPSSFACFTGIQAGLSFKNSYRINCIDLEVELGYEILRYVDALRHVEPISEDAYTLRSYSIGFQGPVLRIGALF